MHSQRFVEAKTISEFLSLWLTSDCLPAQEQRVFRKYYSSYVAAFPDRIRHYYERQTREVLDLIDRADRCRLLEVGCGCGTESLWLALKGAHVDGIDLNQDRLNVARERARILQQEIDDDLNVVFANRSVLDMPEDDTYDVIWMEQTFHHLEPRRDVVRKLAALLAPGGHLVISESNGLNPLVQLMLMRSRGFRTIKTFVDHEGVAHPYGNERVLGAGTLKRLLAAQGIRCLAIDHYRLFPNHPAFSSGLAFEQAFPGFLLPFFTHYNYVGRKPIDSSS